MLEVATSYDGPQEAMDCPWCGGFGWLDREGQPRSPERAVGPCAVCNGAGTLCPADLLELRALARDASIILGGDCATTRGPGASLERAGEPGSRWPNHARLAELVGPDPQRRTATSAELDRWWRDD